MLHIQKTRLTYPIRTTYTTRLRAVAPANLIAGWPLAESGGGVATDESGNGRVGAYSNVTLGQYGIGDGRTAALFNGTSSYCDIYSASLAAAFDGGEGTILAWVRAAPNDGTGRSILILQGSNSNNRIFLDKPTAGGIRARYTAGGTAKTFATAAAPSGWTSVIMTWSKTADDLRLYVGGALLEQLSGLGTWATALVSTTTVIGASTNGGTAVWADRIAHVWLWNTPLNAAQIAVAAAG